MGFVPTGHRPIKGRHFYQAGDNMILQSYNSGCKIVNLKYMSVKFK
jgi:hypothetical protein